MLPLVLDFVIVGCMHDMCSIYGMLCCDMHDIYVLHYIVLWEICVVCGMYGWYICTVSMACI